MLQQTLFTRSIKADGLSKYCEPGSALFVMHPAIIGHISMWYMVYVTCLLIKKDLSLYMENCLTLVLLNRTCFAFANSIDPDQLASSEANWSGSALIASKYVYLCQQSGSSNLISWKKNGILIYSAWQGLSTDLFLFSGLWSTPG